jgi:diguanylate cyclase (GGDEF)-like protein
MQGLLNLEMARMHRDVQEFSIILLDIDHFKRVNDTYGHAAGDFVLQWTAQTMQAVIRVQDVVARWGGEEFLVLLPNTRLDEAVEVAERLRQTVEDSIAPNPKEPIKITFSGGVACSRGYRSVEQICKAADLALYRAKESGRNRVLPETSPEIDGANISF